MHTMEDLKKLLTSMDCTPANVELLVYGFNEAAKGHRRLLVCLALAVYLKCLVEQAGNDDAQEQLELILDLANAFAVEVEQDD